MKNLVVASGVLGLVIVLAASGFTAEDEPKFSIKDVMKKCMKGGLCKKVVGGDATDEEKKELLEMFEALAKNKPPKGDAEDWKEKTTALVKGAKAAVDGKKNAGKRLQKAANCKACHDAHKG